MERNPYFFAVDTDGNQLPVHRQDHLALAENLEVANLRAIAGEYDLQVRHIDIAKLPVFKQNEQKGNYTVGFWQWPHGTDAGFFINQNFDADPEIAQVADEQGLPHRALARASTATSSTRSSGSAWATRAASRPADKSPYYLGPESRKTYSTLRRQEGQRDARQARPGQEGRRGLPPAGRRQGPLILEVTTVGAAFVNWTGIGQMVAEQWGKNIGIKANVNEVERSLMETRMLANNELQIRVWSNDGADNPFTYPFHTMAFSQDSAMGAELRQVVPVRRQAWAASRRATCSSNSELLDQGKGVPADKRGDLGKQILQLAVDNVWVIGTVGVSPALLGVVVQSNKMGNVPDGVVGSTPGQTPGNARPTTFFFKS